MTIEDIKSCKWKKTIDTLSKDVIELLNLIFIKDEINRPSADQLLENKWF